MKQRAVSKIKKTEAATRRSRAIKHGVAESHPVHKSLAEGVNGRRFPVYGTTTTRGGKSKSVTARHAPANDTTNVCQPVGGAEDKQLMVISESRQF